MLCKQSVQDVHAICMGSLLDLIVQNLREIFKQSIRDSHTYRTKFMHIVRNRYVSHRTVAQDVARILQA